MIITWLFVIFIACGYFAYMYDVADIALKKEYQPREIVHRIRRFIIARHAVSGQDNGEGGGFAATNKS